MKVVTSGYFDPLHVGHIECLELEEDFHTDRIFDIDEVEDDTKLDVWWINKDGEQIKRPEPEPTVVQLELF